MVAERVPRVSIGMPVYNGEKHIREAIDSLLAQDFTDFELIISDNTSQDRTLDICQEYAARDPRVRVFSNPYNIGLPQNFNRLVHLARAPYFKWASHDDRCDAAFIRRCVEGLDSDSSVVLAFPRTILTEEDGSIIGSYNEPVDATSPDAATRFLSMFWDLRLCNMIFGVMRMSALRRTHLMPLYPIMDKVFLAELALQGRVVQVPEPLFYRRYPTSRESLHKHMAKWLDPENRGAFYFTRVNIHYHYLRTIWDSDIDRKTKLGLTAPVFLRFLIGSSGKRALQRCALAVGRDPSRRHKASV
jgi:glycosyltransferase involved in cell wall biosynthesis